jgi:hypothetical protein
MRPRAPKSRFGRDFSCFFLSSFLIHAFSSPDAAAAALASQEQANYASAVRLDAFRVFFFSRSKSFQVAKPRINSIFPPRINLCKSASKS